MSQTLTPLSQTHMMPVFARADVAFERGELQLQGALHPLCERAAFAALLDRLMRMSWVVHSKPPFGGPVQVLKYLARYTHRIAIGNRRILAVDASGVAFRYRDRADSNRSRTMKLSGVEFLRRFEKLMGAR